jgi:hypothetical protein
MRREIRKKFDAILAVLLGLLLFSMGFLFNKCQGL